MKLERQGQPSGVTLQCLLGMLLHCAIQAQYRVKVAGLAHFSSAPATLVVANHRRDTDVPIIASALGGRQGPVRQAVLPHFVAREDLFRPGFLGHYLGAWPALLRASLAAIPIEKVMHLLQAYPMRRIPERSLREVLEDILAMAGNLPAASVLRAAWLDRFRQLAPDAAGPETLQELLDKRYASLLCSDYGLAKLTLDQFRQLRQAERMAIAGHLDRFIRLLEQGKTVQLEPEGRLSRDGRLGRLRGGLHILLNAPKTAVRVLPVAVVYDAMMRGRPNVFVRFGPETLALRGLSRMETDRRVTSLLVQLMTLTASQLGCHYLRQPALAQDVRIHARDLAAYMGGQAQAYAAAGAPVDPCLLDREQRQARVNAFLAYCQDYSIIRPDGAARRRFRPAAQPLRVHPGQACDLLEYMDNELALLASEWEIPPD